MADKMFFDAAEYTDSAMYSDSTLALIMLPRTYVCSLSEHPKEEKKEFGIGN